MVRRRQGDVVVDEATRPEPLDHPARLESTLAVPHHVDLLPGTLVHHLHRTCHVLRGDLDVAEGEIGQLHPTDLEAALGERVPIVPAPVLLAGDAGPVYEQNRVVLPFAAEPLLAVLACKLAVQLRGGDRVVGASGK